MSNKFYLILCLFLTGMLAQKARAQTPVITSVSPGTGIPATSVTITGANFSTVSANDIVLFGAVRATVTAASATSLTVTVPYGATYFPVSVTDSSTGLAGYQQFPFIPTYDNSGFYADSMSFRAKTDYTAGFDPVGTFISDIDGDGKPDMTVVNNGGASNPAYISFYRNISSAGTIDAGSFAAPFHINLFTGANPVAAKLADIDGDGRPDLVVTDAVASGRVSIFRNISTAGSLSSASFADRVDIIIGTFTRPNDVAFADFDGDGKLDMVVPNALSGNISVLRNVSVHDTITTASFEAPVTFTAGTQPVKVYAGDLDGDGKPDIAVTNHESSTFTIFNNNTTPGSFTSASFGTGISFATGLAPYGIAVGDIDGDGLPEIVVANGGDTTISVYHNTAVLGGFDASSFAAGVTFRSGAGPIELAMGDLNGDGLIDIAVSNVTGNTISLFRNTGTTGTIGTASFTRKDLTAHDPFGISIGDLDGDTQPDLAVADTSGIVSVYRNYSFPVIDTITGPDSLCVGSTAAMHDSVAGGTWSSSNPAVATIDTSGVVTGISAGIDTITYRIS